MATDSNIPSHTDHVEAVESALYNRMVKNAFAGFFKMALIGAAIGLAGGALLCGSGIIEGATAMTGALHGAAWLAGLVGSFGAVSGIQSTRDARVITEEHAMPEQQSVMRGRGLQPELAMAQETSKAAQKVIAEKMAKGQSCSCEQSPTR